MSIIVSCELDFAAVSIIIFNSWQFGYSLYLSWWKEFFYQLQHQQQQQKKKIVLRLNYFKDVCGNPYLTIFSPLLPSVTPHSLTFSFSMRLDSVGEESDLNGVHFSRCGHFQKLVVHSTIRSKFAKKSAKFMGVNSFKIFF